jgi:hypothetical protein
VSYGDTSVLRDSLDDALRLVFAGTVDDDDPNPDDVQGDGGTGGGGEPTDNAEADLARAIVDAQAAYQKGEEALAAGDFAAYGRAQDELKAALDRAAAAQRRLTGEAVAEAPADDATSGEPPATDAPSDAPTATPTDGATATPAGA